MLRQLRPAIAIIVLSMLTLCGCMGRGIDLDGVSSSGQHEPEGQPADPAGSLFPGLPALPSGEYDPPSGLPRLALAVDNIKTGADAQQYSPSGTSLDGTDLLMTGTSSQFSWAIWRWGTFGNSDFPQQLIMDYSVGSGQPGVYLALSNYTTGRWQIVGPLDGTVTQYQYPNQDFVSENRNSYVAIIQSFDSDCRIVSLNMRTNQDVNSPSAPTGLTAESVLPTRIALQWDDNGEADLDGYNLYLGTSIDFDITAPETTKINGGVIGLSEFLHDNLTSDTDFFYRVTAQDTHDNESKPSAALLVHTPVDTAPAAPTNLQVLDVASKTALVSWDAPADPDIKGYQIFADTDTNFTVPPTQPNNASLVVPPTTQYTIINLDPSTQYFFRVRAVDLGNNFSPLSDKGNFTTLDNSPPEPDFTISPDPAEVNNTVFFDPSDTIDLDQNLSELSFDWDFDNSGGAPDMQTTGAQFAQWVYPDRGVYTVKLTASDGIAQTSITKDILVSYKVNYNRLSAGEGDSGNVIAIDGDANGRIALLYDVNVAPAVAYFDGTSWINLPLTGVSSAPFYDVALAPGKIGVIAASTVTLDGDPNPQLLWTVYEFSGTVWTSVRSGNVTNNGGNGKARLAYSPANGRLSVVCPNYDTPPPQTDPSYELDLWHQKADNTMSQSKVYNKIGNYNVDMDLRRSDDTTYLVYSQAANTIKLGTATDAGFSSSDIQSISGSIVNIDAAQNFADATQVYWTCQTATPRIYWGDNFGSANGAAQFFAPPRAPTGMLGLSYAGDNQGLFYWCDLDASGVDHITFRRTSDSTTTEIDTEIGLANIGVGTPFRQAGNDRVFMAVNEDRDGEIIGRRMNADTVDLTETVYQPQTASGVTSTHVPILMGDDSVITLSSEKIPNTVSYHYPAVGTTSNTVTFYGTDNQADLYAGCRTASANEFFIASISPESRLLLYRYTEGNTEGTLELNIGPVQKVRMAYNTVSNQPIVVYSNDTNHDLQSRTWNGSAWSAEANVYNGSLDLAQFTIAPRPNGEWGVAFLDSNSVLRLAQTNAGTWQAATQVGTDALNQNGGLGFDYHSDGSYALVVERSGDPGIFVGIDPLGTGAGGLLAWEKVETTNGANAYSCMAFYHDASPVVCYHHSPGGISPFSRFRVYEKPGATWQRNELLYDIQGLPIGGVQDSSGGILLLGLSITSDPYQVVTISLTN